MNTTRRLTPPSTTGRSTWPAAFVLALLPVTSALMAADAHAQSNACEMLKSTLTARIDPSILGSSMEIVPASAPVPRGAKVIGNCEAGARKILFRRFGGGPSSAASAPEPARAAAPVAQALAKPAPPPAVAQKQVEPAEPSSPLVQSDRDLRSMPAPRVAPVVPQVVAAASAVTLPELAKQAPVRPGPAPEVTRDVTRPQEPEATDFLAEPWQWAWGLLLLPFAAWGWAWLAHRRAYDEAGLPRGPKLN